MGRTIVPIVLSFGLLVCYFRLRVCDGVFCISLELFRWVLDMSLVLVLEYLALSNFLTLVLAFI